MIRSNQRKFNKMQVVIDAVILVVSYLLAWYLRFRSGIFVQDAGVLPLQTYLFALLFFVPGELLFYTAFGLYLPRRVQSLKRELWNIMRADVTGFMCFILILYFAKQEHFSRQMLLLFLLINVFMETSSRVVIRYILYKIRRQGMNQKHILVFGKSQAAERYLEKIRQNPQWGYHVAEWLTDPERLEKLLDVNELDEVVIALEMSEYGKLEQIVNLCERAGVHTKLIPDYGNVLSARPYIEDVQGIPVIHIRRVPLNVMRNRVIKRMVDVTGAIAGMILFSPVMLVTAVLVGWTGKGSVIYHQERVGLHGKTFRMYKFRSMVLQDPETEKDKWSTERDPRITPVGKWIRRFSIDELPQLYNVLKGEMSLVGPRPERPQFVEKFRDEIPRYMVKHQVRPGMTGWAQVNGYRGDTSIEKRIAYDLYYIENWTIGFDFKILLLTFFKGFAGGR